MKTLAESLKELEKAFDNFFEELMFKDEDGNKVSFEWWRKWKIAKWHWRKWLEYEGMPKGNKSTDKFLFWEKKVLKRRVINAPNCLNLPNSNGRNNSPTL